MSLVESFIDFDFEVVVEIRQSDLLRLKISIPAKLNTVFIHRAIVGDDMG